MSARRRERLFILNDPHAMRISAALAMEIGLNESIVLLQLEFLISISDNVRDGRVWTYQSLNSMRDTYFPFWGKSTLGRTIQSLVEKDLLIVGNFNRVGFDRTQWYALNPVGLARLRSVKLETPISQDEPSTSQNGTWTSQPDPSASQDGTAIPETTSETPTEKREIIELFKTMTPEERLEIFERQAAQLRQLRRLDGR